MPSIRRPHAANFKTPHPRIDLERLETRRLLTAAVWTGDGNNTLFSNPANWQGDAIPTSGQDITFPASAASTSVIVDGSVSVGNIEFDASYTFTSQSGSFVLNGNITETSGNTVIAAPIILNQSSTIDIFASASIADTAAISDGGNGFGISIEGNGPLTLSGAGDTYTGNTSIMGGVLIDTAPLDSIVDDYPTASFTGDASIEKMEGNDGTFTALDGSSPATVNIADGIGMDASSGDTLAFDIGGPNSSSQFDVHGGTLSLGNANLRGTIVDGYSPSPGDVITLIKNETGSAVVGTFNGLPQGATIAIGSTDFTISYTGGTSGNDVTLTAPGTTGIHIGSYTTETSTHGFSAGASVTATDNGTGGTAGLTYTWTAPHVPSGGKEPTFNVNGTHAASSIVARFSKDGTYVLQCVVKDESGNTQTVQLLAIVSQKATSIKIEPHGVKLAPHKTQQFATSILDQFGHPMRVIPTYTYALAKNDGSISSTGLFTAGTTRAVLDIDVTGDSLSAYVGVTII